MPTVDLHSVIHISEEGRESHFTGLTSGVLLQNIRWFITVRWMVAAVFLSTSFVGYVFSRPLMPLKIHIPSFSLFVMSAILLAVNIMYAVIVKQVDSNTPAFSLEINLWIQIIVDLLIVTGLVQIIGSTNTFIAFTYLFHIILACIFFSKIKSLVITLTASGLYVIVVLLEIAHVFRPSRAVQLSTDITERTSPHLLHVALAVFIWLVIWYLVSTVSDSLRKRDQQLLEANERLKQADKEKTQKMLTTVHDLKAPFTGIESNIQVIKYVHWNTLAEPVKEIIERIERRSQTLRGRIRQILTLENLRSHDGVAQKQRDVELRSVVDHVLEELGENIRDKRLAIQIDLPATQVHGDEKQLTELFLNLIFNAITYSHEEGKITIQREDVEKKLAISISDQGIGIKAEALPHIFEEYYRTNEAQQFNKASTGLGMAIVKEIAVKTHLNISISSEVDKGTTVKVIFPEQTIVEASQPVIRHE